MTTMLAADPNEEQLHVRQQALQQRVLLLAPTFGSWKGNYHLTADETEVKLNNQTVKSEDVTKPQSVLLKDDCPVDNQGKAWKKRFNEINRAMDKLLEQYSVPFPIRGVKIIPRAKAREFFEQLIGPTNGAGVPIAKRDQRNQMLPLEEQSVAYKLAHSADEFCNDLWEVRRQIAINNPAVWEAVKDRVPETRNEMRDKFYVDAIPIELAGGAAAAGVTMEDLESHEAVVRDATRRKVEEAIESMVAAPREELARALASLQELIARDGSVTAKSFAPIRRAIEKIRLFDFVANAELLAQINGLERRLNVTVPTQLDSVTAANNGFSAALQALRAEITSAEQQASDLEEFGREFRGIDLD